jgi:hypothetical protein
VAMTDLVGVVRVGEFLYCQDCGRSREITQEWVEDVCRRYFHRDSEFVLRLSDLSRFKCSTCSSKRIEHRVNVTSLSPEPHTDGEPYPFFEFSRSETHIEDVERIRHAGRPYDLHHNEGKRKHNDEWRFCLQCGGDGGATGDCPKCGGTGWEPRD